MGSRRAMMPEAEIGDLIVELRSATAAPAVLPGSSTRMAEVTGRAADQIIAAHRVAAERCGDHAPWSKDRDHRQQAAVSSSFCPLIANNVQRAGSNSPP